MSPYRSAGHEYGCVGLRDNISGVREGGREGEREGGREGGREGREGGGREGSGCIWHEMGA